MFLVSYFKVEWEPPEINMECYAKRTKMKKRLLTFLIIFCSFHAFSQSLVDSFPMYVNSYFVHITPAMNSGSTYLIKVTGTYTVWPGNIMCVDGAYTFADRTTGALITPVPTIFWIWNGIAPVYTTTLFRPSPDIYDTTHAYWFSFTGDGNPDTIEFIDNVNYADNAGTLFFNIYRKTETTGIDDITSFSGFTLFPNPCSDKVSINLNNSEPVEITIYDASSRKLLSRKFTHSLSLHTDQLPHGVYFYEVTNKAGVTKKGTLVKD